MKRITTLALSVFIFLSQPSFAATSSVVAHINGLVCDFCARTLEKTFAKHDEVSDIKVDLTAKTVVINFKDNKTLDDATITKIITEAGYNVQSIDHDGKAN